MMETGIMNSKKKATYVEKYFVIIKNKRDLIFTKKLQIIYTIK